MARAVIEEAKKGRIEIVASGLCWVEVCKDPTAPVAGEDKLADFFEHDYIVAVALDKFVGERGRQLMRAGYAGLKPQDAAHLATAAVTNVLELHTFDDKLLALDRKIDELDGTKLKICKPNTGPGGPPDPPIVERMKVG
jgi:predicted nucleic acid-binding protein